HTQALKENERWERERGKAIAIAAKEQDHFNEVLAKASRSMRDRQDADLARFILGTPGTWKQIEARYKGVDGAQRVLIRRLGELREQGQITATDYDTASKRISRAARGMEDAHDSSIGRMLKRYSNFDVEFRRRTIRIENTIGRAFGRGA